MFSSYLLVYVYHEANVIDNVVWVYSLIKSCLGAAHSAKVHQLTLLILFLLLLAGLNVDLVDSGSLESSYQGTVFRLPPMETCVKPATSH